MTLGLVNRGLVALALVWVLVGNAWAVPSYARQTGAACSQCHTIAFGPQLTPYGRQFKLNGYVWGETKGSIPLSLMTVVGFNATSKDLPEAPKHFSKNDNIAVNEVAGFLAGGITKHVGAFVETAYSGVERDAAWGAFDVRYAQSSTLGDKGVVYGVSINNNPTVTDLWNSTPVWSFPYTGSDIAPGPGTAPALLDGIGERVLGPNFYLMYDDHWYLEAGAYKGLSDHWLDTVGLNPEENLHLDGVATYWRAAYQFEKDQNSYSLGLLGLNFKQQPDRLLRATDRFNDIGVDATYQYAGDHGLTATANMLWVHEKKNANAAFAAGESDSATNRLNTIQFDASLAWQQTWVASLGWFDTNGDKNQLAFPGDAEVEGFAKGSPDSSGYTVQLEYVPFGKIASVGRPWANVRLGLQYKGYQRFNGGKSNYDGFGRSASDNNTVFAFLWAAI